jgi:hypothetical protein
MLFQQPEYEAAFHRLVEREVDSYVDADPILSRINRVRIPGPVAVQSGEGPVRESEPVAAEIQAAGQAVLDGDAAVLSEAITGTAEQYVRAIKAMFYSEAHVLNPDGQPLSWDLILDYWEGEDWSADASGIVEAPAVVMRPEAIEALAEMTAHQQERHEELKVRKQAEYDARRRDRRIP